MNINKITLDYTRNQEGYEVDKLIAAYQKLNDGDEIALLTRTDPKKYFYELFSETKGNFHWIPLRECPGDWEVVIEKSFTI